MTVENMPKLVPCVTCHGETYMGGIANTVRYCKGCHLAPELCKCAKVTCVHCGEEILKRDAEEYEVDDVQGTVYYCQRCWDDK